MRWTPGDRSNIDDERGSSGGGRRVGVPIGLGGIIVLLVLSWATGTNFLSLLDSGGPPPDGVGASRPVAATPAEERTVDFVDAVMKDIQTTWQTLLPDRYETTRVVLFRDAIRSACGFAESATGPFYCPGDSRVYLDLGFFDELQQKFGAPGEFARAYVIAHEVGHHIQKLTGIESRVRELQRSQPPGNNAGNALSVRMELQADCFAGVWGHAAAQPGRAARGMVELEAGDVDEGLRAAASIGDDRLQRMAGARVAPERFTHGSSAQRVEWFRRGLDTGQPDACDTFGRETR